MAKYKFFYAKTTNSLHFILCADQFEIQMNQNWGCSVVYQSNTYANAKQLYKYAHMYSQTAAYIDDLFANKKTNFKISINKNLTIVKRK